MFGGEEQKNVRENVSMLSLFEDNSVYLFLSSVMIIGDFFLWVRTASLGRYTLLSSSLTDLAMQLNQGKFEYNGSCG